MDVVLLDAIRRKTSQIRAISIALPTADDAAVPGLCDTLEELTDQLDAITSDDNKNIVPIRSAQR